MPRDSSRIRGTTPSIERAARHLRQNLTPAEAKLWNVLRRRQLAGLKFRSQHPVGQFIVVFYCPSHKIVVEVDGDIHRQQMTYDNARTVQLQQFGYRVLRVSNEKILSNLPDVLARIVKFAEASSPPELGG